MHIPHIYHFKGLTLLFSVLLIIMLVRAGKAKLKLTYQNEPTFDGVLRRVPKLEPLPKVVYSAAPAFGHNIPSHEMGGECSKRINFILSSLKKAKLTPKFRESEIIQLKNLRSATMEEITRVHSRSYISGLELTTEEAKASEEGFLDFSDAGYSYVTTKTIEESLVAAGTGLSVVDYVVEAAKSTHIPPIGFALIRPPGNRAVLYGDLPEGSCIFNNVAIAARYAQRVHGLKHVFIIDFDAYHGHGTCSAFYEDPDVFYLSTHQGGPWPQYDGEIEYIGSGNGEGTTINVELPKLTGDVAMQNVFDELIEPAVNKFKPDIILVSAGYNGHVRARGTFQMTTGGYYRLASKIKGLAHIVSGGRCVFFLEGGCNLTSLAESVVESFRAFVEDPSMAPNYSFLLDYEPSSEVKQVIKKIKHLHSL